MMFTRLVLVALFACGGKQTPPSTGSDTGSADPPGVVTDTRTEIDKRRDVACTAAGERVTECAVADARTEHAAGRISKEKLDSITEAGIQKKNTEEFVKKCDVPEMSSRQVRVLEVCMKEEAECGPYLSCLDHLNDKDDKTGN
jgi:hypothetical protein